MHCNIGHCSILMVMSPLSSKRAEIYLNNCSLLDIRCSLFAVRYLTFLLFTINLSSLKISHKEANIPFAQGDER